MRWGLCCDDVRVADWLQRFARSKNAPAFLAVRRSPSDDVLYHALPRVEFCESWESLLVARDLAAVLTGGRDDAAFAAMRQFAQEETQLYVRPHPAQGLSLAYELTLIAAERQTPLRPLWPHRSDTALARLKSWLGQEPVGVTHIELERTLNVADIDAIDVDRHVAEVQLDDLDIVRWLGVRGSRITALKSSRPEPKHRRMTITIESEGSPGGMWIAEARTGSASQARLTVQTSAGAVVLEQSDGGPWMMADNQLVDLPIPSMAGAAFFDETVTWDDAVAVFEWSDAIERSLERRRAIDLHSEPVSERTIFKSQMAALGCAVLLGTLLLTLIYLGIATLIPLPGWLLLTLRTLVFAPLFLFLLAQLLLPLTRSARS